jgi:broad specificity phosphatase PhoE
VSHPSTDRVSRRDPSNLYHPMTRKELAALAPGFDWDARIADWDAGRDPSPQGGESMAGMGDRVADLVASLLQGGAGQQGTGKARSVVLVAHGEVIGAYLGRVRDTPPPKRHPHGLANGSITVVDVAATGAETLVLANHVPAAR